MRLARRVRTDLDPTQVWTSLGPAKRWGRWLLYPDDEPPVTRVKLPGGDAVSRGSLLHVLREDHSWTRLRIDDWAPGRRLHLVAEASGNGDAPETSPMGPRSERIIVIPQGSGAEVECLVDMGSGLRSLLRRGTVDRDAWNQALDARLHAIVQQGGGQVLPDPHRLLDEAEP